MNIDHNHSDLSQSTTRVTRPSADWIGKQVGIIRRGVAQKEGQEIDKIIQACQSWEALLDHGIAPATIHDLADTTPADLMFLRYYAIASEK